MHTKIKICGIKSLTEVEFINQLNIDYIGFVFAKSKRQIGPDKAAVLSGALRQGIKKVGVFVDHTVDEINSIIKKTELDIVQLHKNYTEEMIAHIHKPVWYAVSIKGEESIAHANTASKYANVAAIVTDAYVQGMEGGTGKTFNWDLLSGISSDVHLVLAGGLNADNVDTAISKVNPDVVDISSGAETTVSGVTMKSGEIIKQIIRKVKT